MNRPILYILSSPVLLLAISSWPLAIARADNLSSPGYRVQMGTINITGGNKTGGGYKLSDTVGQTFQGLFSDSGYKVRAGFQYARTTKPFSFKIDRLAVSLGSLTPNLFTLATNTLTVGTGGAFGYSVKAIENHALQVGDTAVTIPDTACDPISACSINDATPWVSTTAYGFGYNISGDDVDISDFVDSTYFRPFANNTLGHDPVIIMRKTGATENSAATVTYKVNISPTQTAGEYENAIQYLALPAY